MKNVHRLKTDIDVKPIYNELDMKNGWEKWSPDMIGHSPVFKHSSRQILLRHADASPTEVYSNYKELHKFLSWFEIIYGGEIVKASYYILPLSKKVDTHEDGSIWHKNKDRFHLVLSGKYSYKVDGEKNIFEEGDLWWFDNKKMHGSHNIGTKIRLILVIDVCNSHWRSLLYQKTNKKGLFNEQELFKI